MINGNKILFVRFPKTFLTFPKGTVEEGETLEQTALREVYEETGLAGLSIIKKLGIVTRSSTTRAGKRVRKDIHLFLMTANSYSQGESEEVTEWHTLTEALPQMHKEEAEFLKDLSNGRIDWWNTKE